MRQSFFRRFFLIIIIIILVAITLNIKTISKKLYPLKYEDEILKYSNNYNLDPYLIAAIISVESGFEEKATSHKGAIGLMQILPKTGEWAADEIGLKSFNEDMLYQPEINIRIGTWYVNKLNNQFNDIKLVLAAYNGGSGNVSKWLKNKKYSPDGKKLKEIPFKETSDYLEKVELRKKIYEYVYKGEF